MNSVKFRLMILLLTLLGTSAIGTDSAVAADPPVVGAVQYLEVMIDGEPYKIKVVTLPGGDFSYFRGDSNIVISKNPSDPSLGNSFRFLYELLHNNPNVTRHWQVIIGHGTEDGRASTMSTANGAETKYVPLDEYVKQVKPIVAQSPATFVFAGQCYGGLDLIHRLAIENPGKTFFGATCPRDSGSTKVGPATAANYVFVTYDAKTNTLTINGGPSEVVPKTSGSGAKVVHNPNNGLNALQMEELLKSGDPAAKLQEIKAKLPSVPSTGPAAQVAANAPKVPPVAEPARGQTTTQVPASSEPKLKTNPSTRLNSQTAGTTPLIYHADIKDHSDGSKKLELLTPIGFITMDLVSSCQPWDIGKPCVASQVLPFPLSKVGRCAFRKGPIHGMVCEYVDGHDQAIRKDSHLAAARCVQQWFELSGDPANAGYKLQTHVSLWEKGQPNLFDPDSFGIGKLFAEQCQQMVNRACKAAPTAVGCEETRGVKFSTHKIDTTTGAGIADSYFDWYKKNGYEWALCAKYEKNTPSEYCGVSVAGINFCEAKAAGNYDLSKDTGISDAQAEWDLFMNSCMDRLKVLCRERNYC